MALIKCPECGRERVSDSALACPDCGFGVRDYVEFERKKAEDEIATKEKTEKELIEKKEKLNKLKEEYKIKIEKIKNSQMPEKFSKENIDFKDDKFVLNAILLGLSFVFLVLSLVQPRYLWLFVILGSVGGFLMYKYIKNEKMIYEEITKNWDEVKLDKIEKLKKECEKKANNILEYGNVEGRVKTRYQNKSMITINKFIPKCPICGSTHIKRLTAFNRFFSIIFLGPLSAKFCKQFECQNCECRW